VRLHVFRVDRNRPLKLLYRIVGLAVSLVEQAKVVVDLGAGVVLLEQRAVMRDRIVEIADALIVERQAEVILRRRRGRWRRRFRRGLSPPP
jgi:flagellar basal body P-ring protein FlgI